MFVVAFALLAAADFTLGVELVYIAALALSCTAAERQRSAAEVERLRERDGLPMPSGRHRHALALAARLVVWAGFLGTACFAGGLLAAPFG